ncbi:saccharopine dehydrogenase family protein [Mycolicibacterium mucogenicum]|uniref:saccharopine dehydrogenase family protein n=1 Tax=Mycolicibacterium mucogenicum TaxID=56689 RepID=UPI0009F2EF6F|nr:saccharopine dehydrogenase NADP-binding domain-containing protein [Mycolicibacterium mucogenicum]
MKVLALGGSGGMGRRALAVLANETPVDEVIVADLDEAAAHRVAEELRAQGQAASARRVDVSNTEALRSLITEADLVMNSVGPYFRFGPPVLQAAIDAGKNYIDICDDAEPTRTMFALDGQARAAGVTAIIGAGASPGFMNMLAREAAVGLDEVEDVTVAWTINNPGRNWDLMRPPRSGGVAATVHLFEQFTGTVPVIEHGGIVQRRTREPIYFDVAGLGRGTGYVVGHPEPLTVPISLGARGRAVSVCLLGSERAEALHRLAEAVERKGCTLEEAARRLRSDRLPQPSAGGVSFAGCGDLPTYFVLLTGSRKGRRVRQYAGCLSKPEAMSLGTGVPYGVATAQFIASVSRPAPGVHAVDAVLDPQPYFARIADLWGVDLADLYFVGLDSHCSTDPV